jgi:hypothetical protein
VTANRMTRLMAEKAQAERALQATLQERELLRMVATAALRRLDKTGLHIFGRKATVFSREELNTPHNPVVEWVAEGLKVEVAEAEPMVEPERNQCDGCARRLPLHADGMHYEDGKPHAKCSCVPRRVPDAPSNIVPLKPEAAR